MKVNNNKLVHGRINELTVKKILMDRDGVCHLFLLVLELLWRHGGVCRQEE